MKKKTIKALMGLVLSLAIFTTGLTGVYAEGTEVSTEAAETAATTDAAAETPAETTATSEETKKEETTKEEATKEETTKEDVFEEALGSDQTTAEAEKETEASTEATTEVVENKNKPYLALGENLKDKEKAEVLKLLGIDADKLDEYTVLSVTNKEEHHYLDKYVAKEKIGSRALSSIVIRDGKEGEGLNFNIYNIDYCTVGMYKNVCTTVGIKDADITIAGPFKLSGTAALIGIVKAYEAMTGDTVSEEVLDAAMNELVVTGDLENSIDGEPEEIEAFMADLKSQMKNLKSEEDIKDAIEKTAKKYNLTLSQQDIDNIYYLLNKLKDLDLDWDFIEQQANDLAGLWKEGNMDSFWDKLVAFFMGLLKSLTGLFG